jgi:hypothetical protein
MNAQHYDPAKVRAARKAAGFRSARCVGRRLNVHQHTILRVEAGIAASYELLCEMAVLYHRDIRDWLHPTPP